jgi:hypothetical protein
VLDLAFRERLKDHSGVAKPAEIPMSVSPSFDLQPSSLDYADERTAQPSIAPPASSDWPPDKERRRYPRFPLALGGRYMLEDGSEFSCQTQDVSAVGVSVQGFPAGAVGGWVVVYLDGLGRVEGAIVRGTRAWFVIEISATPAKLERLAKKINHIALKGAKDGQPIAA